MSSQFLAEALFEAEGKTHNVRFVLPAFDTEGIFQVRFQLEDFLIRMSAQLVRSGDFSIARCLIVGDKASLKVQIVEVFDLIVDTDFNHAVFFFPLALQAVGEIELSFVEFDAVPLLIVETL